MPVIVPGESDQLDDGAPDGGEGPANVPPAPPAPPRLPRPPQQFPKPGFQLDQVLPGDAGEELQIPKVWIRLHGLHLSWLWLTPVNCHETGSSRSRLGRV